MIHPRTLIRAYTWDLLKDEVKGVGSRIFLSRPHPVLLAELPCINIYFAAEPTEMLSGDRYIPQEYERKLNLSIDVCAEQPNDPAGLLKVEDELDSISLEIEDALHDDIFYEKRFPDYDPSARTNSGLIAGLRLLNTLPAQLEILDRVVAMLNLSFELTYETEAFIEHRWEYFTEYLMKINRVGWDEHTVDPTLIEASGDL